MSFDTQGSRRGVALVITLSMLVLITVLVVSFTTNMRLERQVAHTVSENERTKLVAEAALAHAVSILSTNIPQPVPPIQPGGAVPTPVNWAVNPGLLNLITGPSTVTPIPLSTNPSAGYVSSATDANLNQLQASNNQYPIVGTGEPMYVAWANVLQNPAAAAAAANPIASRYAFWIDDENAKINVNTAYGKPASGLSWSKLTPGTITETANPAAGPDDVVPLGHPGSINLDVFGTVVSPANLLGTLKTNGAAKTPEIIKTAVTSGDPGAFYQQNKFSLTATSRDPEFNVFGKSRIYMYAGPSGQLNTNGQLDTKQGGGLFQRFRDLDAPMYFHGNENRDPNITLPPGVVDPSSYPARNPYQDYTAMYYTVKNLATVLSRRDWPGMPARSFVDKWGGNDAAVREADQVAWNFVAMGSFCDFGAYTTATQGLSSIFGNRLPLGAAGSSKAVNYPNAAVPVGPLSSKAMVPAVPRPMIDEICLNILPETVTVGGASKYRLLFTVTYGLWLPPGYPTTDFGRPSCDFFVGLTHLDYAVTQGTTSATQTDTQYLNNNVGGIKKMQAYYNADAALDPTKLLQPDKRLTLLPVQNVVDPALTPQFYARNGQNFNSTMIGVTNFLPTTVHVTMNMRLFVHSVNSYYAAANQSPPSQLIPVWDKHDPGSTPASTTWNSSMPNGDPTSPFYPPSDDPNDCVKFDFDLDLSQFPGGTDPFTRSLYIDDPRMGGLAKMWQNSWQNASSTGQLKTDSLDQLHNGAAQARINAGWQTNKFAYVDMAPPIGTTVTPLPHPSTGIFSLVPTGMQRGLYGSNLKLQPNTSAGELPDWLLLDLFAPTVSPAAASTAWTDIVKMNATAGKINVNAAIYPNTGSFARPSRLLPLQALFAGTRPGTAVAQKIVDHTLASSGHYYAGNAGKFYSYPGEVCEISGVADTTGVTDLEKEAAVRNLASAITTKSNTFSVWGVAQTIKKVSSNHQYGQYEKGDLITGEKRFQAIIERSVWPGADGIAGNGSINSGGTYDSLTQGTTQPGAGPTPPSAAAYNWEKLDGPDAPTYPINSTDPSNVTMNSQYDPYNANAQSSYTNSVLEKANNPVGATMKYRTIYFKYLD